MAFHWQTFKTRTLTAVVFVAVMAAGLLWSRWTFFALFTLVHFGCWAEYQKLVSLINKDYVKTSAVHRYGVMIAGWCSLLYFTSLQLQPGGLWLNKADKWLAVLFVLLLPLTVFIKSKSFFLKNLGYSLFGLLYISLSLALLIDLRNTWLHEDYRLNLIIPLLIIFTLWVNDTMAYMVGSLMGKTPLTPISPKKTWEGTIGGVILAVAAMCLLAYLTGWLSLLHTAFIALLASIAGTYGDLFQSSLKRMAGVKDSGTFLPGHGGFLDRFDSLLFASTAVWFYVQFFLVPEQA